MRLLAKIYLVISFFFFTFISNVNILDITNFDLNPSDYTTEYVLDYNESEGCIATVNKIFDSDFSPNSTKINIADVNIELYDKQSLKKQINTNNIAHIFNTEVFPEAP